MEMKVNIKVSVRESEYKIYYFVVRNKLVSNQEHISTGTQILFCIGEGSWAKPKTARGRDW